VLVIKKRLLGNPIPSSPGGGTVLFVTRESHQYSSHLEERYSLYDEITYTPRLSHNNMPLYSEEGGTPDIVGAIRAGLAFQLKEAVCYKSNQPYLPSIH
jgi:selenocysteine lyase/cysteine desulfurase